MNLKSDVLQLPILAIFFLNFFCKAIANFSSHKNLSLNSVLHDFKWNNALGVMTYHRNKMNEYLCKNYIANEIIEGYKNLSDGGIVKKNGKLQRRIRLARESLLTDPGSRKYQDWLSRSSTLEDIYHQFDHSEGDSLGHAELEHDDGSDVTGYSVVDSKHIYHKPIEHETDHHYIGYIDDSHYHYHDEEKDDEKGLKLKEIFHFALTSIAFLAFATFMIEVIMSLLENPTVDNDYVLVPTTTGTAMASKTDEEISSDSRHSRSLLLDESSLETLNIMSSKILLSIETLAILHEDNGECFQRSLCQNMKYSKTLSGPEKIWLPLWSFGMSWIGKRLSKQNDSSSNVDGLKYIRAAVTGLGNKECHVLHPKCDEALRRRLRKKKRVL